MVEYALLWLTIGFALGVIIGILLPITYRLSFVGRCRQSPTGEHDFRVLKGAYAYCMNCTARKRFRAHG